MSAKYNILYTKKHLSKLIDRVIGGEEIIIAMAGKPVAGYHQCIGNPVSENQEAVLEWL